MLDDIIRDGLGCVGCEYLLSVSLGQVGTDRDRRVMVQLLEVLGGSRQLKIQRLGSLK